MRGGQGREEWRRLERRFCPPRTGSGMCFAMLFLQSRREPPHIAVVRVRSDVGAAKAVRPRPHPRQQRVGEHELHHARRTKS